MGVSEVSEHERSDISTLSRLLITQRLQSGTSPKFEELRWAELFLELRTQRAQYPLNKEYTLNYGMIGALLL